MIHKTDSRGWSAFISCKSLRYFNPDTRGIFFPDIIRHSKTINPLSVIARSALKRASR